MNKSIKRICIAVLIALVVLCSGLICAFSAEVKAEENATDDNQSTVKGIYTSLSISTKTEDSNVFLVVKNELTIFPSTVKVQVFLYSSMEYTENYENMSLEDYVYTSDLDMGDSIMATASTQGVTKYWLGRVRYKVDNDSWVTKSTIVYKISGNGEYIE